MKKKFIILLTGTAMLFSSCNPKPAEHVHSLSHHSAVASTCVTKGSIEYWDCSECGKKFSDENAQTEISSIEAPLGEHDYQHVDRVEPTETEFGMEEHYECSVCEGLAIKEGDNYVVKTAEELKIAKLIYFDVDFDFDGIPSQHIKSGDLVQEPEDPEKEDDDAYSYEFVEWQLEGETYDFSTPVESSFTLEPVFDETPIDYTITFTFEGELAEPVEETFNCETDPETFEEPEITPDDGYHVVWTPAYDLTKLENQSVVGSFAPNTDTPYTVEHYLPKFDGTGYELYDTEDKEGTTDTDTEAEALSIVGFTANSFDQENIEGDGTTVVEIYYDRDEMKFAKDNDVAETTIETVTDFGAEVQKVTLTTDQYGVAWTSLVPNFTKDELEDADGIEFTVKLPAQGTMMCANNNRFAENIAGNDFRVVRLTKEAMLSDYHGKKTIDDIYTHMIYPGSRGMGFLFSNLIEQEVSIELLSANLYTGELNPLANSVFNAHDDQAKNSAFVNSSNIAKFEDAPALPQGATGMVRVLTQPNSSGVSDFRFNPTGLFTKEELTNKAEIGLKIYVAPFAEEGTMTFNAYLNNVHFSQNNAVGQWVEVKVPTNLVGVQESCASLSAAYDAMVGGWVRMPEFQFKLNNSGFVGGKVTFYFAGVNKVYEKIDTLINTKNDSSKTLTYIDSGNITPSDPELPSGEAAMMKVNVTSDQYGVSNLRLNPFHYFTYDEMKNAQTVDLLVYMAKGTGETFTAMLKNTEQFAKNLSTNQWVTINIPVQLLLSQGANPATEQQIVDGWIDFVQFVYDTNAATTYYVGGVSLTNKVLNANNASNVMFIESDQGPYTNTYVTSATKTDTDPAIPEGYSGYVKLSVTTDTDGLCNIRFNNPLINNFNLKWGHKISFKLYCTGADIDSTVALSWDNNHNHGSKNANEWIDYEWDLTERGTQGSADRLLPTGVTEWKWISLCRVQFKKGGSPLSNGAVVVYIADITIK